MSAYRSNFNPPRGAGPVLDLVNPGPGGSALRVGLSASENKKLADALAQANDPDFWKKAHEKFKAVNPDWVSPYAKV